MAAVPSVRSDRAVRALEKAGFKTALIRGSHRIMLHSDGRVITVPMHPGRDIARGTLRSISEDSGIAVTKLQRRWNLPYIWSTRRRGQRNGSFSPADWELAIGDLDGGQQRYIRMRWAGSIELLDTRHRRDVQLFYLLRSLSVLGGVAITALSGIGLSGKSSSEVIRWFIFALGFLVAGSAGLEQLGHYSQHRLLARQAREQLLTAGFGYLLPTASRDGFEAFRKSIENILRAYNQSYNKTISGSLRRPSISSNVSARVYASFSYPFTRDLRY